MNDGGPAVQLEQVARRYGRNLVLSDVSLSVRPGRLVVLSGANGAGKTTLLRVLATRLRPSRGRGRIFGHDLLTASHEVRKRTALLSVFGGSYPALTAAENLTLAARLYGKKLPSAEVDETLESVGLASARDELVRSFSSGMKKRLGVARLRLSPADLWLLDEPYAALDSEGRSYVDGLLADAKESGKTIVLASHEPERLAGLADATLRVEAGGLTLLQRRDDSSAATPGQGSAQRQQVKRV